jgi:hypothetical protein
MLKKGYLQNQKLKAATVFIVTYRHVWFDKFEVTETAGEGKYIYFM